MQETCAQTAQGLSTKYMILKNGHDHMHSRMKIELSVIQDRHPQVLEIQQVRIHGGLLLFTTIEIITWPTLIRSL